MHIKQKMMAMPLNNEHNRFVFATIIRDAKLNWTGSFREMTRLCLAYIYMSRKHHYHAVEMKMGGNNCVIK